MASGFLLRRLARRPLLLALLALLTSCSGTPQVQSPSAAPAASAESPAAAATSVPKGLTGELTVFAAASLTEPFTAIAATLKKDNPDLTLTYNFAGSNQLAEQLNQGAPADVFASANAKQMGIVIGGSRVISGTERTFVRNRLVVVTPKDNPADLQALSDLAKPGVKIVLAAAAVPVGQYAFEVLGKASKLPEYGESFSQTVTANVVSYEENVKAALAKVSLGEADAGIVYTTDAATASDKVGTIDIPDELNSIAAYPIAALNDSPNATAAAAFVSYILSPAAQTVLAGYGFIPTTGTATSEAPGAQPLAVKDLAAIEVR